MKNKEKYVDEIMESFANNRHCDFVKKFILKDQCFCFGEYKGLDCADCPLLMYHCSYCKTKFYESTQRQRSYTSNSAKESGVEK